MPRGSFRPSVSQLSGDLLDHELRSIERDRVTDALALQLSIDRRLGGDAHDLVAVAHKVACRHRNTKNCPPSFTAAPSSTLLFGPKFTAESFSTLYGVRVNGVVERSGQVARELSLRLLVVFDRLASIEPGAPDIFQLFLYPAPEVARLERQHCLLHAQRI
jgi:hypothetical protein